VKQQALGSRGQGFPERAAPHNTCENSASWQTQRLLLDALPKNADHDLAGGLAMHLPSQSGDSSGVAMFLHHSLSCRRSTVPQLLRPDLIFTNGAKVQHFVLDTVFLFRAAILAQTFCFHGTRLI
jgi:hypothetical protein